MTAIRTGLIGSPLKSSLSPRLFKIFASRLGKTFSYSLLETRKPEALIRAIETLKARRWRGFNVTLPLKEAVIPFLSALSPEAAAIGAVNAVTIKNDRLRGYNTDAFAVELALKEAGCRPRGRTCVIWGAGGAARAAAWVLAVGGAAKVAILGRTMPRARSLAKHFGGLFPRVSFTAGPLSGIPRGTTVFVNATPLGMYAPLAPALRLGGPPGSIYLDFAYSSTVRKGLRSYGGLTPFLEDRSGTVIPGIDLLIYQALKTAELLGAKRVPQRNISGLKNRVKAMLG